MTTTWAGDAETKPAPGPLARIQALVNTVELPAGTDRLADPGDAAPWLTANGLLADGASPTPAELDLVRGVREALRALLIHNSGGPSPEADQLAVLKAVTDAATARVDLAPDGQVGLSAAGDSVGERLLELLLVMRDAQRDGTWARLKACGNDECTWAFYDRSRNHGGTWCVMSECGNKLKNREFRARRRAGGAN
ncbi:MULTISPECIES: ABATE domain-containing protein [unclassified Mycolicibacterium]|uniref:CGNR zinc finger domain-containing protein n=1 Tax=unclassified Mycolicibacterium TaxID=2636767 RepID=UPI0012DCF46C|nr:MULTISPECIES: ABATE domain-containing protein [unclassified Mycolicibacterium]MUL85477.1 RNA-binding protein [Mycolicibacterium sp. CBMA 329]MUL88759.1 RNA-binding protein [Mycolicibacterium sp. CBMA 331]MUM01947.1 RNA-binding protein [Mycolicibacterium sp. CBMA 334]MUM24850.1 RNA-binding protein [Mycolicibacterium sp. CBMA 295]MUM40406.1 RNA-binding protein [Mycolicibacterium sp. CBMA 247]